MAAIATGLAGASIAVDSLFKIQKAIEANTGWIPRPQHNTHITNLTKYAIQVVLQHSNGGVEIRVLEPLGTPNNKHQVCIPTPNGRVEVFAIRNDPQTKGMFADCRLNDSTDRSFFVEVSSTGLLTMERAKYGTTTVREGMRS